jgi:3-oxoacyl-[acyl-carrier-protein] synthase-3
MAYLNYKNIGISAMAGAVPANTVRNIESTEFFDEDVVRDIVAKTGIKERRFAPPHITASDLCFHAAKKLFEDNVIDLSEIDVLIFISQTPDYRMPATSVILQDRLGLNKETAAFDISLGCSGFVYGLSMAYNYAQHAGVRKVLLLDGETRSRVYHPKDRQTAFIFGDAGVACIVEKNDNIGESFFSLNSDGSREGLIKIDSGGYRNPSTKESLEEKVVDENGNIRTDEHGYMNGSDVFNFVLREIPKNIRSTIKFGNKELSDFDFYVFHQANSFMNDYLVKKLKLEKSKIPETISKYGNTSSVSIPITIIDRLRGLLEGRNELLLCGFGVGLSWATAIVPFHDCSISEIVEVG